MVQPLTVMTQGNGNSTDKLFETEKENEGTQNRQKFSRRSTIINSMSLIVLHVLDTLLLMALLPFMIWQWISANDRLKLVLKAVVEVTLELLMWLIFAGVSILLTTAFVLDDGYFQRNRQEKSSNVKSSSSDKNGSRILKTQSSERKQD